MMTGYIRRDEAAKFLQRLGLHCTSEDLSRFGIRGGGPSFTKFGRFPMYTEESLKSWAATKLKDAAMAIE